MSARFFFIIYQDKEHIGHHWQILPSLITHLCLKKKALSYLECKVRKLFMILKKKTDNIVVTAKEMWAKANRHETLINTLFCLQVK